MTTLYQFIQQEYARGQRDALTIQEAARAAFPHKICGLDYVQKIMRAMARDKLIPERNDDAQP